MSRTLPLVVVLFPGWRLANQSDSWV